MSERLDQGVEDLGRELLEKTLAQVHEELSRTLEAEVAAGRISACWTIERSAVAAP